MRVLLEFLHLTADIDEHVMCRGRETSCTSVDTHEYSCFGMLIHKPSPEPNERNNADRDISPLPWAKRKLRLTLALLGFPHLPTYIDELVMCRD